MRTLLFVGVILVVIGLVLLFVPIPHRVRHGFDAGPVSVGVTTNESERVHPAVAGGLVAGGIVLMIVGSRKR
jgi:uncharacterized membrane protein